MIYWDIFQISKDNTALMKLLSFDSEKEDKFPIQIEYIRFSGEKSIYISKIFLHDKNIKPYVSLNDLHVLTSKIEEELSYE